MSRDPYRSSANDIARREYDRVYERDHDRHGDERIHYEEEDIAYTSRRPAPLPTRLRERSPDIGGRGRGPSRGGRTFEDERIVHERRYVDDDNDSLILPSPARRRNLPTVIPDDFDRRVTVEHDKLEVRRQSPPPPRPGRLVRRQSSVETFDRRPARRAYDFDRVEDDVYERAPVRLEDLRGPPPPAPNVPIPLPRRRRRGSSVERERDITTEFDEIRIGPGRYGPDEGDFRHPPDRERERIHETEIVRTRREESRTRTSRARSRSASTNTSASSRSGGATLKSARNEYPKKGKTRMPARLVSERALIDLHYPFIKEGNTIVVQVALGQDNIDDVLRLSRNYKKSEEEVIESKTTTIKTSGGEVIEETRRREDVYMTPAVQYAPPPPVPYAPVIVPAPVPEPVMQPPAEYTTTVKIRDVSPARSYTTTTSTAASTAMVRARSRQPPAIIVDAGGPAVDVSEEIAVGPMALVAVDNRHRRSHSHGDGALYARIHGRHHHHDRHDYYEEREYYRPGRELVSAERLSSGEIVVYQEQVERFEEPRNGVRIEKDKKGRMSISVPKYR